MSVFDERDGAAGPPTRTPPSFVPTLMDVVDWVPPPLDPDVPSPAADAQPQVAAMPEPFPESGHDAGRETVPSVPPPVWPIDAVIDEVVDRALDRLVMRLTDELERHLALQLARWRNEEARAWAASWVSAQMDQGLSGLREQVRELADEEVGRLLIRPASRP